jgi:hypothetical protein
MTTDLHLVSRLRTNSFIPLLPHMPSWDAQRHLYPYCHIMKTIHTQSMKSADKYQSDQCRVGLGEPVSSSRLSSFLLKGIR